MKFSNLFERRSVIKSLIVFAVLVACLTSCSSSSDEKENENSESQVEETDQSSAIEAALAAAKDDLAAAEDDLAAAEAALAAAEDDLAAAEAALAAAEDDLEDTTAELTAVEETAESTSRDLEGATMELDKADLVNQLLEEERWELRDALDEAVELANSLDDTEYPDCNPVHAEDRSLFGIPIGTDMAEVISQVTERCGPSDPFIPMLETIIDPSPDRDQWGSMCVAEDVWTRRVWQTGARTIAVNFYRTMDDSAANTDTGWMFGWEGGDMPAGIQGGMTKDEVTDILDLDPNGFIQEGFNVPYGVNVDEAYRWGEGAGWGPTVSTHGQPDNVSLLYFAEGVFWGFAGTDYSLCQ